MRLFWEWQVGFPGHTESTGVIVALHGRLSREILLRLQELPIVLYRSAIRPPAFENFRTSSITS